MSADLAQALEGHRSSEASFEAYKREQARIARKRLYPLTVFYWTYSLIVLLLGLLSAHPWIAMIFHLAGIPVWTLVEYGFHRYVLRERFPPGRGSIRRFLYERLDRLHWEHHKRPFDGGHISGELKDTLPLFFVTAPLSFVFPLYSMPVLLAGVVQNYVAEEWTHYFLHFGKFRNRLFRHLKRDHLYCHVTARAGWKRDTGSPAGFGTLCFTRSTLSRFASH